MRRWLRKALANRRIDSAVDDRRIRVREEPPPERFVLIIELMIIFFVGLAILEVVHILALGSWNDTIFSGIMLVVGTIVGALFGRNES
jgi:hypothetical protein